MVQLKQSNVITYVITDIILLCVKGFDFLNTETKWEKPSTVFTKMLCIWKLPHIIT